MVRQLLAAILFLTAGAVPAAEPAPPGVAEGLWVEVDGRPRWVEGENRRLPPASLTKIMTGLLVSEAGRGGELVTISRRAAGSKGKRLGLKAGERMSVDGLLASALILSAGDATLALAEWHSGSAEKFVAAMNRRAAELGLKDTHFANPSGLDAKGHYSSAADLARLTHVAMANPRFAALVAQPGATVRTAGGREFRLESTNALIGRFPGATGVKTGYTHKAGPCLVALAERGGVRVLLVMLNASNRWWDAAGLLERAFTEAGRGS